MYTYFLLSINPSIKKKNIPRKFNKITNVQTAIKNILKILPKTNKTYTITILEKETKYKKIFNYNK